MKNIGIIFLLFYYLCNYAQDVPKVFSADKTKENNILYGGGEISENDLLRLNFPNSSFTESWIRYQDSVTTTFVNSLTTYQCSSEQVERLIEIGQRTMLPVPFKDSLLILKEDDMRNWKLVMKKGKNERPVFQEEPPIDLSRLFFYIPSPDGKYVALSWMDKKMEWRILDVAKGQLLNYSLKGTDLTNMRLVWYHDSTSFYYTVRMNTDSSELTIKQHFIKESNDQLIYKPLSGGVKMEFSLSEEGDFLVVEQRNGADKNSKVLLIPTLDNGSEKYNQLIDSPYASFTFLANKNEEYYFETDADAANGKIIKININHPEEQNWKEIVKEAPEPIAGYQAAGGTFLPIMVNDKFVVPYQKNLAQFLKIFNSEGIFLHEIPLPSSGLYFNRNGLNAFSVNENSMKIYTRVIGLVEPSTVYEIDIVKGTVFPYHRASTNFNASNYQSEIIFCKGRDGDEIPITLTYRNGMKKDGKNPLMLQVYGALAFTNYPYFQGDYITWLEMGGIHAVAHIRGGGAKGSDWHQQGINKNKQQGINDYIDVLEFLINNGFTSPTKTVVNGVSAGTIPAAAALVQKPNLVGAAILHYGMLDLISYAERFSSDENYAYMIPEIGDARLKEDFEIINKYSPYQNLRDNVCYPPVFALTSNNDSPLNTDTYKFIAALQSKSNCSNPYMLYMAWDSYHATFGSKRHAGKKTFTDELTFLKKVLDIN